MRPGVGFFVEHPLGRVPESQIVEHTCPACNRVSFEGPAWMVLEDYRDHVIEEHIDILEECGCCGGLHFAEFDGDCREDAERF